MYCADGFCERFQIEDLCLLFLIPPVIEPFYCKLFIDTYRSLWLHLGRNRRGLIPTLTVPIAETKGRALTPVLSKNTLSSAIF